MTSHKLFSDSFSPNLNSSMGSKGDASVSSASPLAVLFARAGESLPHTTPVGVPQKDSNEFRSAYESDSDSMDEKNFFVHGTEKQAYTFDEDVEIIKFVLKDQNIYRVSSVLLWKYLEAKKTNPRRTYQSLKNRFLRNIKPKLFSTYSHLIKNQEQVKRILEKFPELRKEFLARQTVSGLNLPPRKGRENEVQNQPPGANGTAAALTIPNTYTSQSDIIPGTIIPYAGEICSRSVKLTYNGPVITVNRQLGTRVSHLYDKTGIYEKFLKLKRQNKSIPCPTCGRCEEQLSVEEETDCDDVISNSAEYRIPQKFDIVGSPSKVLAGGDNAAVPSVSSVGNVSPPAPADDRVGELKNVAAFEAKDATPGTILRSVLTSPKAATPYKNISSPTEENQGTSSSVKNTTPAEDPATPTKHPQPQKVKGKDSRHTKRKRKSSETSKPPVSPSLLGTSKSSGTPQSKTPSKKPTSSKKTKGSSRKAQIPEEEPSMSVQSRSGRSNSQKTSPLQEGLTDRELESLYQETVLERQKLMDSEEEEELVKKCLKKSRRMIGFDSYVLLNKANLDSFFAKSISPPLDSSEPVTSAENKTDESGNKSDKSALVENMKKMLKKRSK